MKGKNKVIKAWAAIDRETGDLFQTRTAGGWLEICLHPTKKDYEKTGYGDKYWEMVKVKITYV